MKARMGYMRHHTYFSWKIKGIRPFGRLRRRTEDNIKVDIIIRCGLDSTGLGYDSTVTVCEHNNKTSGSKKCG
jgi:hypothetical protein